MTALQPEVDAQIETTAAPTDDPVLRILVPVFILVACLLALPAGVVINLLVPDMSLRAYIFVIGFGSTLWCAAVTTFGLMVLRLSEIAAGLTETIDQNETSA